MNNQTAERLYHLLPAIYRQRDAAQGEPLRALLAVMETELQAIETDIEGLYENWFIETCEEWVVPYIADLLGISSLSDQESTRLSHRSYVANTIAYRRRKGVSAILESITLDVTGWRSRVVEGFDTVSVTQQVNHTRPGKGSTLDIRNNMALNQLDSPFNQVAHTIDVRRMASAYPIRGKSNVLNMGLFVWRLQSYPVKRSPAVRVQDGCYTVHPLGRNTSLFNRLQTKTDIAQRTEAMHLPCPIDIAAFTADLQDYQTRYQDKPTNQLPPNSQFYGPDRSFNIIKDGIPVPPMQLVSLQLDEWQRPTLGAEQVAIDVQRGRLVLPLPPKGNNPSKLDSKLEVSYCYGFSGDIGGGVYDRPQTLADLSEEVWSATVGSKGTFQTLQDALATWGSQAKPKGVIRITDNGIYDANEQPITITLPASKQLTLEAADGNRPGIRATRIVVEAPGTGASLILNGLLLDGIITLGGKLDLTLIHCTVLGGIEADQSVDLQATIAYSLVGPLRLPDRRASLTIRDSTVDSRPDATTIAEKAGSFAIAANDAGATLERTTVFGQVSLGELPLASNVIFTAPVTVQRQHTGGIRFSYVPIGSETPPRYRCQPDLALENLVNDRDRALLLSQLTPSFTSVTYGDPGYAQLSQQCAQAIGAGADDGSEMGVFHLLHQPQRRAYLHLNLEEYVPSGLDIGIFYVT